MEENGFNSFMTEKNETSRSRWNLWRFSQFHEKDLVIVPLFDKEFAICQVLSEAVPISNISDEIFYNKLNERIAVDDQGIYSLSNSKRYDIGFLVRVKMLTKIPRSYADVALTARMKIRQANADINDIYKSVENALHAQAPVSIHDSLSESVLNNLQTALMQVITPEKLERVVQWYMKKKGANLVTIPAKNQPNKENGADADVIAEFNDLRVIFYIQVKKHEGLTDDWAVQQISEYKQQMQDDSNDYTYISWVISTAEFSDITIAQANENGVRLIGGSDFVKMLIDCGINDIDEAM